MTLAMSSTSSARSARLLAGHVWGQDSGQGLWLLSGHTWEDGGEEAGALYDDAGHVQHQLRQVSQAAHRTRLGQEPDTFIIIYFIFLFFLEGIQSTAPL
jgi:hypothetical protein